MLLNAKNGSLPMDGTTMDYIRFGTGKRILIMLPGLGDGLRSMKGTALPVGLVYRRFAKEFTVYVFSRKTILPEGSTTRDMARDVKNAMDVLGIKAADLFGVSMGGMIAQHFAADYPERLNRLVLAVTSSRLNPTLTESVTEWMQLARDGDHTALMDSNLQRIYSDSYYRKNKWLVPILWKLTKPKSYARFLVQGHACMTHDSYDRLPFIQAETLVIGGEQDHTLGGQPSRDIAAQIPHAQLKMYPYWGHGAYEEAPDFNETVLNFLQK